MQQKVIPTYLPICCKTLYHILDIILHELLLFRKHKLWVTSCFLTFSTMSEYLASQWMTICHDRLVSKISEFSLLCSQKHLETIMCLSTNSDSSGAQVAPQSGTRTPASHCKTRSVVTDRDYSRGESVNHKGAEMNTARVLLCLLILLRCSAAKSNSYRLG